MKLLVHKRVFVLVLLLCMWLSGLNAGETGESKTLVQSVTGVPAVVEKDGELYQLVQATVKHSGEPADVSVDVNGRESVNQILRPGKQLVEALVPAVQTQTVVTVDVKVSGQTIAKQLLILKPVRQLVIYLLPHSHVDIGYTHVQTEVERIQWRHFENAMEISRKTADYAPEARSKWNVEVLWAVESYLKQASEEKHKAFIEAVKKGWIGLDALYGNELTGLCRPEELIRLVDYAQRLRRRYGVTINSAMISDVPGYTWGIVPVLAQSGVKYFSIGPNPGHRIGYTLSSWGDRPFYWVSASGRHKVLCWMAGKGYAYFHGCVLGKNKKAGSRRIFEYLKQLEDSDYPYDMVQVRYSISGDNGPPDPGLPDFVKQWNSKYAYPKLGISTTGEMFEQFERRYTKEIPAVRGDFTPYWEDGAASSASETAINRAAAERLVQAETLWAMLNPQNYPAEDFYQAWRNVILYDEHTWGAHNSITKPDIDFVKAQWEIKQAFALKADVQSRKLLSTALGADQKAKKQVTAVSVFITSSWGRTDIVVLGKEVTVVGDVVKGPDGKSIPSQRLSRGELAFIARDVPALGARRFTFHTGKAAVPGSANAEGTQLSNGHLAVTVNGKSGAIESLRWKSRDVELVDRKAGLGLNDYFYVAGRNPNSVKRNGPVKIMVKEPGPVVASLLVESDAPGCRKLMREVRIIDGLDRVDIINVIDKQKIYEQESVHFGFAFSVPEGVMRMDIPWAVVRPEADQLAGACKNYFTVQRWVDISNQDFGVTWATVDAPMVEVGTITVDATVVKGGWFKHIEPAATLYSYVMNNYWETNYKAGQEGPTMFRYSIRPHGRFDSAAAKRFGIECSQPLIAVPVEKEAVVEQSLLSVKPTGVLVTAFKPSEDGKAWIVRLFNAGGRPEQARLTWAEPTPKAIWLSNLAEEQVSKITEPIDMAAYEFITLRASLPIQFRR